MASEQISHPIDIPVQSLREKIAHIPTSAHNVTRECSDGTAPAGFGTVLHSQVTANVFQGARPARMNGPCTLISVQRLRQSLYDELVTGVEMPIKPTMSKSCS
jgi:hypothetical protein